MLIYRNTAYQHRFLNTYLLYELKVIQGINDTIKMYIKWKIKMYNPILSVIMFMEVNYHGRFTKDTAKNSQIKQHETKLFRISPAIRLRPQNR